MFSTSPQRCCRNFAVCSQNFTEIRGLQRFTEFRSIHEEVSQFIILGTRPAVHADAAADPGRRRVPSSRCRGRKPWDAALGRNAFVRVLEALGFQRGKQRPSLCFF